MVVYTYNPSYLGGSWFEASPTKKLARRPSQPIADMAVHAFGPRYAGSINRIAIQASLDKLQNATSILKIAKANRAEAWFKW
jgi:hypothetical protein